MNLFTKRNSKQIANLSISSFQRYLFWNKYSKKDYLSNPLIPTLNYTYKKKCHYFRIFYENNNYLHKNQLNIYFININQRRGKKSSFQINKLFLFFKLFCQGDPIELFFWWSWHFKMWISTKLYKSGQHRKAKRIQFLTPHFGAGQFATWFRYFFKLVSGKSNSSKFLAVLQSLLLSLNKVDRGGLQSKKIEHSESLYLSLNSISRSKFSRQRTQPRIKRKYKRITWLSYFYYYNYISSIFLKGNTAEKKRCNCKLQYLKS